MARSSDYNCPIHLRDSIHTALQGFVGTNSVFIKVKVSSSSTFDLTRQPATCSDMDRPSLVSQRTSVSTLRNVARSGRGCLPSSGDTTILISQRSEATELSHNHAQFPAVPPSPTQVSENGDSRVAASHQSRRRPIPRELVDEDHLCTLIAAYNIQFEKYSAGRSNVTQLIPSQVWKSTYATYKEAYPQSIFRQESLKDRLRDTLKELKTGKSNVENAEQATLQSNHVMAALRCTDGHAKTNVLRKRAAILETNMKDVEGSDEESGEGESDYVADDTPPSNPRGNGPAVPPTPLKTKTFDVGKENIPFTKAQLLYKLSTAIERISDTYHLSTQKRDALVDLKIVQNEFKHTKNRLDNLKIALDLGVISDGEFKASALQQDSLWIVLQDQLLEIAIYYWFSLDEVREEGWQAKMNWEEVNAFMEEWRALLGPLSE